MIQGPVLPHCVGISRSPTFIPDRFSAHSGRQRGNTAAINRTRRFVHEFAPAVLLKRGVDYVDKEDYRQNREAHIRQQADELGKQS